MSVYLPNSELGYQPPRAGKPLAAALTAIVLGLVAQGLVAGWPVGDAVRRLARSELHAINLTLPEPLPEPPPKPAPRPLPMPEVAAVKRAPPRAVPPPAILPTRTHSAGAPAPSYAVPPLIVAIPDKPAPMVTKVPDTPPVPEPTPAPKVKDTKHIREAYAAAIWQRIAAHRPRGMSIPGRVRVTFTVGRDGSLSGIAIAQSSGDAMLDQIALRTLRATGRLPPPPAELGDADLRFVLPFGFQ